MQIWLLLSTASIHQRDELLLIDHAVKTAQIRMRERDILAYPPSGSSPGNNTMAKVLPAAGQSRGLLSQPFNTAFSPMLMHPPFACPLHLWKTTSYTEVWDEGKWLCGMKQLRARQSSCTVYAVGSNRQDTFERTVQSFMRANGGAGCNVHIYDPTLAPGPETDQFLAALRSDNVGTFHPIGLASHADSKGQLIEHSMFRGKTFELQTIGQMMRSNGHECIDILKVDIEGMEHDLITGTEWGSLCVGMFLVEYHSEHAFRVTNNVVKSHGPGRHLSIGEVLGDVHKLERAGFFMYSMELVCVGFGPALHHASGCAGQTELAFVNASWLKALTTRGEQ